MQIKRRRVGLIDFVLNELKNGHKKLADIRVWISP
jgi:hypothetical protein